MTDKRLNGVEVHIAKDGSGVGLLLETKGSKQRFHLSIEKLPKLVHDLLDVCYEPEYSGHLPWTVTGLAADSCCATFLPEDNKVALGVVLVPGLALAFAVPIHHAQKMAAEIQALTSLVLVDGGE